jgi:hypothetical protein
VDVKNLTGPVPVSFGDKAQFARVLLEALFGEAPLPLVVENLKPVVDVLVAIQKTSPRVEY